MNDDGSAALEFITVGVILLVPIVYLVIALGAIQEQTLGVEAAARHTARVIALAPDAEAASIRGEQVLASVASEYGVDEQSLDVSMVCVPAGVTCPAAGATITITVTARVALPLIPSISTRRRALRSRGSPSRRCPGSGAAGDDRARGGGRTGGG